jgi:hypothetical protein
MKPFIKVIFLKNSIFFIAVLSLFFCLPDISEARVKTQKITISTVEGAKIYVNGTMIGANPTDIKVPANSNVNVKVEKIGYITEERNFINDDKHTVPKSEFIKLEVDDAYENSFTADIANHDIDIKTNLKEDDAWKLISRIITNSFDVIQVTDKATGYMCTAWVVKNFRSATIRTRLIIKTGNSDPLVYKAKLVSEKGPAGVSANQDENFKPWDRVLRTFENVIPDLQSRLGK